ncbi:MAG: hemerythrin domain-containing protein [Comamonadaceae bacterium]|nr:hemerythrin domain-containing protein [Comamonadaceae bacterium]
MITEPKNDHKRVKKAYKDFEKLESKDAEQCQQIVQQVLLELTVHAALEEELLYPAARNALKEADLIDEAEVEHESAHQLIDQLRTMSPDDEKYVARFTVCCASTCCTT